MLTIEAPAKINLTLEILGKRSDGFHEIRSVIQTIDLCDTFQFTPGDAIRFTCDKPDWSEEQSLVTKAVRLIRKATGINNGATIKVTKRIPLTAGLGGDSSDAAAVLRGLDRLWGLNLPKRQLLELAGNLGSDVPFFLYSGTALMEGRGEIITPLPPFPIRQVIIIVPQTPSPPGKTARAYGLLKSNHFTDGKITERLIDEIKAGEDIGTDLLFNTFENVVFAPSAELTKYRKHILKMGAPNIHLAGSGPALFILLNNESEAEGLYAQLKNQDMQVYLTKIHTAL